MNWTRSETLALAANTCTTCHGLGMRTGRRGSQAPCHCVFRAIFRICYQRFIDCADSEKSLSTATLEYSGRTNRRVTWGRKKEEYCADFFLVTRRALEPEEFRLFKYHYLYGADWSLCTRQLKMDRGTFFHAVYRIQQKLGRVFAELQPYSLFPLDAYFGLTGQVEATPPRPTSPVEMMPERPRHNPGGSALVPPLRKAA